MYYKNHLSKKYFKIIVSLITIFLSLSATAQSIYKGKIIDAQTKEALAFVNKVGAIAESEGHHPDISIFGWNKVKIHLSTHATHGLSDNDFILAAKIDEIER